MHSRRSKGRRGERRRGEGLASIACLTVVLALGASAGPSTQSDAPLAPRPVTDHALGYYDASLERVVLVGGKGDPREGDRDSVWSWTGQRWELVSLAGPPGRVNGGGAYDVRRGKAVVAGGSRKSADGVTWQVVGDSWEGGRDAWQRLPDITPRDHQALVEDERGWVLMFGGIPSDRSAPWPTETWAVEEGAWKRLAVDGPGGRGRTAMAFDRKRRQVVLFGGVTGSSGPDQPQVFLGDTWIWAQERWRKVSATGPRGRYAHGLVFDDRAGVVLLYGGAAAHRGAPLSDMWQWNGAKWSEIPLTGSTPGHRYQPVMVYDRARGRTVLYGGIGGASDTWEWDGAAWHAAR